ncbi:MAG: hypothetical protein OEY41_13805, partial [Acidimicrobiia bacterium]|nr:hypothetical protein [Acidimicrobiia bacterium]
AGLTAFADGFFVISLQGAVGAVERVGDPFRRWITTSILLVPGYCLAVAGAVALARWWFADGRHQRLLYASALLAMIGATTIAGVVTVAGSSAYDYHLQSARIERVAAQAEELTGRPASAASSSTRSVRVSICVECEARRRTLESHVRGGTFASLLTLVTNTVLVMWVVALRGGQLWIDGPRRSAPSAPVSPDPKLAIT